ncbi:MAG: Gfo/Idh/MocA family protein [Faecousia sp.]
MKTVRYGIIGLGVQGMTYACMLAGVPLYPGMPASPEPQNCYLSAISSRDPQKQSLCAQKFPGVPFYADWREMVTSGAIDAAIITVPHYQHPQIAIFCMEHGVSVLVEKPAGVYSKSVREMNACSASHPEAAMGMMFQQRVNPVYRRIKEILDSGEMGRIRRCNLISTAWWRPDSYYEQSPWRGTWGGEGGGILLNQAVHQLDLWIWLCGMPKRVQSICRYGFGRNITVENDVTAIVEYADGAVGSLTACSHDAVGTTRFEIDLDGGKILIEDGKKATVRRLVLNEQEMNRSLSMMDLYRLSARKDGLYTTEVIEYDGNESQHLLMLENFAQHLLDGTTLIAPGEDGICSVELVNAILLSDWLKQPVFIPVDEGIYLRELNQRIAREGKFPQIPLGGL